LVKSSRRVIRVNSCFNLGNSPDNSPQLDFRHDFELPQLVSVDRSRGEQLRATMSQRVKRVFVSIESDSPQLQASNRGSEFWVASEFRIWRVPLNSVPGTYELLS